MRMNSSLVERAPGETEVTITSQVNVMGILAQFGRGMIEDLSDQMFGKFVTAARAELEQPESQAPIAGSAKSRPDAATADVRPATPAPLAAPAQAAAAPVDVLSLGSAVVGRAAARNAPLWIAVVVILFVLVLFWFR